MSNYLDDYGLVLATDWLTHGISIAGIVISAFVGTWWGWKLSEDSQKSARKRRHIDDFRSAVLDEIRQSSNFTDEVGNGIARSYLACVDRIRPFAVYMQEHDKKSWENLCAAWEGLAVEPRSVSAATGEMVLTPIIGLDFTKDELIRLLNNLLNALNNL